MTLIWRVLLLRALWASGLLNLALRWILWFGLGRLVMMVLVLVMLLLRGGFRSMLRFLMGLLFSMFRSCVRLRGFRRMRACLWVRLVRVGGWWLLRR